MAHKSDHTFEFGARRRSQRVLMQVALRLRGVDVQGQNFEEFTETLAINAHGALVLLEARVTSGSVIQVRHNKTEEEQECHVVFSVRCVVARPR